VDQHENRDLISEANAAQNPNPGSVSRRSGRDFIDVSPRVGAVRGSCCNNVITFPFPPRYGNTRVCCPNAGRVARVAFCDAGGLGWHELLSLLSLALQTADASPDTVDTESIHARTASAVASVATSDAEAAPETAGLRRI
jgi:hypothetical protein